MTDRSNDSDQGPGWRPNWSELRTDPYFDFRLSETLHPTYDRLFQEGCFGRTQVDFDRKSMKDVFLHFAVATHKKEFLYYTVGMLPSSWNFVGVPTSHVFSFFQLSGSCKFFAFEYYTSNSNSKDGASRHHHRAVARRIFKTCFCWIWQKDHINMELPTFIMKSEIPTFCEAGCIGGFCERYCFEVVWGAWSVAQLRNFFGFWDIQFVPRHFLGHWTSYPTSMLCYTSHLQHQTLQPKRWSWYLQAFSMYWTRTSYPRSWEGRL